MSNFYGPNWRLLVFNNGYNIWHDDSIVKIRSLPNGEIHGYWSHISLATSADWDLFSRIPREELLPYV